MIELLSDFWHWWTAPRVTATAALTTGIMAVVTGSVAVRTLRHNRKANQRTTRPMMIATLKPTGIKSAALEVTNAGPSMARDVKITFDPPLPLHEKTSNGENSVIPYVRRRFASPIDTWAPDYTTRNIFLLAEERDSEGHYTNIDNIPRETAILFDYRDDDGNTYVDRISLDPRLLEGETWSVTTRRKAGEQSVIYDGSPWLS